MLGGLFYLVLLAISLSYMLHQPWLGIEFKQLAPGVAELARVSNKVAGERLKKGEQVWGISCASGDVPFTPLSFVADPEETPNYQSYHDFFTHQAALYACLSSEQVSLLLSNGRSVPLTPLQSRPFSEIPVGYWITQMLGFSCLVFGLGVWAHRRGEIPGRLLVLWSVSITLIVHSMSVYGFRELALDADLFLIVHKINRFSVMMMGVTILTLVFYYPRRLSQRPCALMLLSLGFLLALNESFELFEWPLHTFYLPLMLIFLTYLSVIFIQWLRSRKIAMDRAIVIWLMLSIVLTNGGSLAFYALPAMLGKEPLTSLWVGQGFFLLMFIGFALGVVRYRLFDVERWWLMTWVWFFGGLLVVLLDMALVIFLNLQPAGALSIAVLVVAWSYLPLREWLWTRLYKRNDYRLETYLPQLVDAQFSASTGDDFIREWPKFLSQIYHSADVIVQPGVLDAALVDSNGCDLKVPALNETGHVLLSGKEKGSRLFTRGDSRLASGLLRLARRTLDIRLEREKMVNEERNRIMRDLHDDVGAQLLALVHLSENQESADIARGALKSLREMVYALRDRGGVALQMALGSWREEVTRRAASAGVESGWQQSGVSAQSLSYRQSINLGSILREAVTNALKHGQTTRLQITVKLENQHLYIEVSNDGAHELPPPEQWLVGAGRANMSTRAEEINARIEWTRCPDNPDVIIMSLDTPLEQACE